MTDLLQNKPIAKARLMVAFHAVRISVLRPEYKGLEEWFSHVFCLVCVCVSAYVGVESWTRGFDDLVLACVLVIVGQIMIVQLMRYEYGYRRAVFVHYTGFPLKEFDSELADIYVRKHERRLKGLLTTH